VPKHLVIIGGGVIEWIRSGIYVSASSVVEYMDRIIPGMDASLSKELTKVFKKQGMNSTFLIKWNQERNYDAVTVQAENKGETITLEGDYS
jgi:dihydrolipoamide dehydrogenase